MGIFFFCSTSVNLTVHSGDGEQENPQRRKLSCAYSPPQSKGLQWRLFLYFVYLTAHWDHLGGYMRSYMIYMFGQGTCGTNGSLPSSRQTSRICVPCVVKRFCRLFTFRQSEVTVAVWLELGSRSTWLGLGKDHDLVSNDMFGFTLNTNSEVD